MSFIVQNKQCNAKYCTEELLIKNCYNQYFIELFLDLIHKSEELIPCFRFVDEINKLFNQINKNSIRPFFSFTLKISTILRIVECSVRLLNETNFPQL